MSPFAIFVRLYMIAFLMEMVEKWKYPGFTLAFLGFISVLMFLRVTRLKFFIFLLVTTTYFFLFRFPDVANHVNLILYLNSALMIGMAYAYLRRPDIKTDNDFYEMICPLLRASLASVYFWAGFHKFNFDFLNPEISCASTMLDRVQEMLQSDIFGLPTLLFLTIVVAALATKIFIHLVSKKYPHLSAHLSKFAIIFIFSIVAILVYYLFLSQPNDTELPLALLIVNLTVVLAWELLGSLLLLLPSTQGPVVLWSWFMHAVIAMIGFVDFSSLALSLLFTFVPSQYLLILSEKQTIKLLGRKFYRIHIYFMLNVVSGLFAAIFFLVKPFFDVTLVAGLLFNLASFIFLQPIFSQLLLPQRLPWQNVPVLSARMPLFMIGCLCALGLYAFTPYLGLRTAGNFSMFSNLRTEGESSNHILLGRNPFKLWSYQEDVVQFFDIEPSLLEADVKNFELEGNLLPIVEFRKMIYKWTQEGDAVPLKFEYSGQIYDTPNIVEDPLWRTDQRTWEMFWQDFRVIQADQTVPNLCRW